MLLMFGADANFGFTLLSQLRNIAFSCFPILYFSCCPWGFFLSLFFFWGWGGGHLVDLDLLIFAKSLNGKKRVSKYFY